MKLSISFLLFVAFLCGAEAKTPRGFKGRDHPEYERRRRLKGDNKKGGDKGGGKKGGKGGDGSPATGKGKGIPTFESSFYVEFTSNNLSPSEAEIAKAMELFANTYNTIGEYYTMTDNSLLDLLIVDTDRDREDEGSDERKLQFPGGQNVLLLVSANGNCPGAACPGNTQFTNPSIGNGNRRLEDVDLKPSETEFLAAYSAAIQAQQQEFDSFTDSSWIEELEYSKSNGPSQTPSASPSLAPTESPSIAPSASPSSSPSNSPSASPSSSPSESPSSYPSSSPTGKATKKTEDSKKGGGKRKGRRNRW